METCWFFRPRFHQAYDSSYGSDCWFSLGLKRSYDSAYDSDSDSVASENQPLGIPLSSNINVSHISITTLFLLLHGVLYIQGLHLFKGGPLLSKYGSPERDHLWWHWLTFRQPERKSSSMSSGWWIVSRCCKSLVVFPDWTNSLCHSLTKVVCLLSRDVIGCEDCKPLFQCFSIHHFDYCCLSY